jgi:outer membrane receptor protein involved in Fe transport
VQTAPGLWLPYFNLHRSATEAAVFADGSFPLADRLRLTTGARLFRSTSEDERQEASAPKRGARALTGFTPSLSLSYDLSSTGIVYARFATAFRPGGIDPGNVQTGRYDADEVRSVEAGARLKLDDGKLALDIAGYGSQWRDMQSDYLETNGLIATHNVGDANILGGDASLDWRPDRNWRFKAGMTLQRARLVHALGGVELPADRRLPLIPDIAFRLLAERRVPIGELELRPYAAVNFNGAARLSFDDGLDRAMPGYGVFRTGASVTIDPVVLRVDVDNLFDTRADTFAYGNPFSIRTTSQYTPLRPRSVTLSVSRSF